MGPGANYTLHEDGSVTINMNYIMHERPKDIPNADKVWKSSGYFVANWIPMVKDSLNQKDWKIKNYFVHVLETSDDFGKSSDG